MIAHARDIEWETDKSVSGCHCSKLNRIPPCSNSINAFGTDKIFGESNPPDFFRDDSKGIKFEIPPATACIWPYEQMYSDDIKASADSNQTYDYRKRLNAAKKFFSELENDSSLIFYYVNKSNPFSEEDSKNFVLVGVSRLKKLGQVMYYENVSEENKQKYADGFVWQMPVSSYFPDQGFCIPYHKYRNDSEVLERITYIPEISENFKYGTRHISDDDVLIYIERLTEIVDYLIEKDKSEDWIVRKEWLISIQNELWKSRGPFPGLGSILDLLEMPDFFDYYKENVTNGNPIQAKEEIFKCLNDKKVSSIEGTKITESTIRDYQKKWLLRIENNARRELLENIICRVDITKKQIENILAKSRNQNNIYSSLKEIIQNPYILSEEYIGNDINDVINFEKIDHALMPSPEINLNNLVEKDDWSRLRALFVNTLKAESVHSFLDSESIIAKANNKLAPYPEWKKTEFNFQYVEFDIEKFEEKLVFRKKDNIHYVYLKDVYEQEQLISTQVRNLVTRNDIEILKPFTTARWENEIFETESILNKKSPDEYKNAIQNQISTCEQIFRKPISVLSGAAGTGKTTVIKAILQAIKHVSNNNEKCLLLAPTGKAADRLRESTKENAQTIHQLLAKKCWLNPNFTLKKDGGKKEEEVTTFIIDETSMIDLSLMATLFKSINWDITKRIILVGDPNQLPPIGRGKVFSDIIEFLKITDSSYYGELVSNFRQMENRLDNKGTGIIDLASIYVQDSIKNNITAKADAEGVLNKLNEENSLDKDLDIHIWNNTDQLESMIKDLIQAEMDNADDSDIMNFQVISPYRGELYGTENLNITLQNALNNSTRKHSPMGGVTYYDKIIQFTNRAGVNSYYSYNRDTRKNDRLAVYNGEMGRVFIHPFDKKRAFYSHQVKRFNVAFNRHTSHSVEFKSDNQVAENIELGYAISVHKAQGSEFNYLFLVIPQSKKALLSTELIYTGITRAKTKLSILVEKDLSILHTLRRPELSKLAFINSSLFEFNPLPREFSNMSWYEEGKIHKTLSKYLVRSKSEVIITNLLVDNGIESFKYEEILEAPDKTFYLPDFTIHYNGKTYYWEHVGMLNIERYKKHWETKEKWYNKHFPNQLLVTYESENLTIDAKEIIEQIKE